MPRARLLKPTFFTNEALAELPPVARLLFQGLWCIADKEGRLEDRPKRIKAEVLPYDRGDPDRLLGLLNEAGFIDRYELCGTRYIQIVAFTKHQHPHPNEPASVIPASVNVTSPHTNGSSTRAESIPSIPSVAGSSESLPSESLVPLPRKRGLPRSPAEAGTRAHRALEGSKRQRDVEALKSILEAKTPNPNCVRLAKSGTDCIGLALTSMSAWCPSCKSYAGQAVEEVRR